MTFHTLFPYFIEKRDIYGKLEGFIEKKSIVLIDSKEKKQYDYLNPPCLAFQSFDLEASEKFKEHILKFDLIIELTLEQEAKIKKFIKQD